MDRKYIFKIKKIIMEFKARPITKNNPFANIKLKTMAEVE